jgi:nucleoid-associated protein YgaU
MSRARPIAALVGWCVALAAVTAGLTRLGHGPLAAPPFAHPARLLGWANEHDPATSAMALLRMSALGVSWYFVAVTAIGGAVRLAGLPRLVRAADGWTIAPLRRLLHASLGAGLAVTAWAGPASAAVMRSPAAAPVMRALADDAPPPSADPAAPEGLPADPMADTPDAGPDLSTPDAGPDLSTDPGGADTTPPPDAPNSAPAPPDQPPDLPSAPPDEPAAAQPAPPAPPPAPTPARPAPAPGWPAAMPATYTVRPGDNFWQIARSVLADARGRPPGNREIASYWHRLIDANRARLAHPNDPGLLFKGQVLDLPPRP